MAQETADNSLDVEIVERALAILDEESRAWVTRLESPSEQVEGEPDA